MTDKEEVVISDDWSSSCIAACLFAVLAAGVVVGAQESKPPQETGNVAEQVHQQNDSTGIMHFGSLLGLQIGSSRSSPRFIQHELRSIQFQEGEFFNLFELPLDLSFPLRIGNCFFEVMEGSDCFGGLS
jgi:hypothetical protein